MKNYNLGVTNHENYISIMSNMLDNQKMIDHQIAGTNDKIYKSVDMRKKKVANDMQKNRDKAEDKKLRVLQDKKYEQVKIIYWLDNLYCK